MKKIALIVSFCFAVMAANAQDQPVPHSFQDINHKTIVTFRAGKMYDKSGNLLGGFGQHGVITDSKNNVLGYILNGSNEFQDANHKTIGYMKRDGAIEDGQHNFIGRVDFEGNGPITDKNHNILGYLAGIEATWGTAYFILYHFN